MGMCLVIAKALGIKTVITEHTHFLYNDLGSIHLNKVLKFVFNDVDAVICVSHACKENFSLRCKLNPEICFTIPNAVDTNKFVPRPWLVFPKGKINIVCISRLT
jgi:phosphatidylinositol glycan class A protein